MLGKYCQIGLMVVFVRIQFRVWMKLIQKFWICHVEVRKGDIGCGVIFTGGDVEESIGKIHVRNLSNRSWRCERRFTIRKNIRSTILLWRIGGDKIRMGIVARVGRVEGGVSNESLCPPTGLNVPQCRD